MSNFGNILKASAVFLAAIVLMTSCDSRSKKNDSDASRESASAIENGAKDAQSGATEWVEGMPAVIDFYATWCGPCKMIAPVYDELAEKYAGKINFVRVDVDKDSETARKYGIEAMPTFVFLDKDGKEVNRIVGADAEALEAAVGQLAD